METRKKRKPESKQNTRLSKAQRTDEKSEPTSFKHLCTELQFMLFAHLPSRDLGALSLVSKELRNNVQTYIIRRPQVIAIMAKLLMAEIYMADKDAETYFSPVLGFCKRDEVVEGNQMRPSYYKKVIASIEEIAPLDEVFKYILVSFRDKKFNLLDLGIYRQTIFSYAIASFNPKIINALLDALNKDENIIKHFQEMQPGYFVQGAGEAPVKKQTSLESYLPHWKKEFLKQAVNQIIDAITPKENENTLTNLSLSAFLYPIIQHIPKNKAIFSIEAMVKLLTNILTDFNTKQDERYLVIISFLLKFNPSLDMFVKQLMELASPHHLNSNLQQLQAYDEDWCNDKFIIDYANQVEAQKAFDKTDVDTHCSYEQFTHLLSNLLISETFIATRNHTEDGVAHGISNHIEYYSPVLGEYHLEHKSALYKYGFDREDIDADDEKDIRLQFVYYHAVINEVGKYLPLTAIRLNAEKQILSEHKNLWGDKIVDYLLASLDPTTTKMVFKYFNNMPENYYLETLSVLFATFPNFLPEKPESLFSIELLKIYYDRFFKNDPDDDIYYYIKSGLDRMQEMHWPNNEYLKMAAFVLTISEVAENEMIIPDDKQFDLYYQEFKAKSTTQEKEKMSIGFSS